MGKKRIIAETGAGQHGVATASVAARFGLDCHIYMGAEDMRRQALNVFRMRLLGAEVIPVSAGTATLQSATSQAMRDWVTNVETTYYVIGSVVGPHPYPTLVRDFQSIIGHETLYQMEELTGRRPNLAIACVGGGSNAMGMFYPLSADPDIDLIGVEAAGQPGRSGAAPIAAGVPGVLHGSLSYVLQDEHGQILPADSIAAGLDYPGVGPEHAYFHATGRAKYVTATDSEALAALQLLSKIEGIIPALESAHAVAAAARLAPNLPADTLMVVCLSGRGDKDLEQISRNDAFQPMGVNV